MRLADLPLAQYNKVDLRLSCAKTRKIGPITQFFALDDRKRSAPSGRPRLLVANILVKWPAVFKTSRISQADCNKTVNGCRERFSQF